MQLSCKTFLLCTLLACLPWVTPAHAQQKVPQVIFETDVGNDVDDALALDMLYKYLDKQQVNVLAICSNKDSKYSTGYIHLLNYWYGHPGLRIGRVINGIDSEDDAKKYAEHVCLMKDADGKPLFKRPAFNADTVPDAVVLYRQLLARAPDHAVTIISVGFSTNISRLLQSAPDKYSPLSGRDLIARKVKLLSMMAGSFGAKPIAEYNVKKDIPAAQQIANEWPTPIVYAPAEIGEMVLYPGKSIANDFSWTKAHPVVEAYKYYLPMPYDRPCWDLLALLYVMENDPKYFGISPWGKVAVDDKGFTAFTPAANGNRAYLTVSKEQAATILHHFVNVITAKPAHQQ